MANLPLSIRVQTTLPASVCHAPGHALKKNIFFDVDIVIMIVVDKSTDNAKPRTFDLLISSDEVTAMSIT